jgi:hypothetical protein
MSKTDNDYSERIKCENIWNIKVRDNNKLVHTNKQRSAQANETTNQGWTTAYCCTVATDYWLLTTEWVCSYVILLLLTTEWVCSYLTGMLWNKWDVNTSCHSVPTQQVRCSIVATIAQFAKWTAVILICSNSQRLLLIQEWREVCGQNVRQAMECLP